MRAPILHSPSKRKCRSQDGKAFIAIEQITIVRELVRIEELLSIEYLSVLGRVNEFTCLASANIKCNVGNPEVPLEMTNGVSKIDQTGWRNCEESW